LRFKSDLPQGTLDLLILRVIALGPIHGYAIREAAARAAIANASDIPIPGMYAPSADAKPAI
jgi:hypothetical protein